MAQAIQSWTLRLLVWFTFVLAISVFAPQASAQSLTNDDVAKMAAAQLPDSVIIAKIKSSKCEFDTSPDALISLKKAGLSDAVLQALTNAMMPPASSLASGNSETGPVPTALGMYALDGAELNRLAKVTVTTKIGIGPAGGRKPIQGYAVDGLSGEPNLAVRSSKPIFIVYDEGIDLKALHLSRLVYINEMQAYQFNAYGTQPQFFPSVYGLDYKDAIPIRLWRPTADIAFSIEPVEGKPGMYRLIPGATLENGKYAIYTGEEIHRDGIIFATNADRQSDGYYFSVGTAGTAAGSKCSVYEACLRSGLEAFMASQWDLSLSFFQQASALDPARGDAWAMTGYALFELERYDVALSMTDKALRLGATLTAKVCRVHGLGCEQGRLQISTKQISFVDLKGKQIFGAPLLEASSQGAQLGASRKSAYFSLKSSGKRYDLYLIPEGITCDVGLEVECPEPGFTQQKIFANYIQQTVEGAAKGKFK